ncbi:MAG: winged helix-turn-helix transcriptional regulator [Streptosporangiaceae bacterium]
MPLPKDYTGQQCSLARALETVGERWTLLIVRDAFFGVRRFGDFVTHLGIPRAVLAERLSSLTGEGVLSGTEGGHGHTEYVLTGKGLTLWPVVRSLLAWGDDHYSDGGPRRVFEHAADGGTIGGDGTCPACGQAVPVQDLLVAPGPGLASKPGCPDPVSAALASPHRLVEPVRA